jgi:hypothetical protein
MKNFSFITLILLSGLNIFGQSFSGPESVEYDYANSRWLISNTQSHQVLARDSNGVLSIFTTLTGTGPYGIEIAGDTLFCCNGASIKGFLLSNAQLVFNVNVGAMFLNGITHDNNGNLIATDFSGKAMYKINIASLAVTPIATGLMISPNGIIFDQANNRCVFVNWGSNAPVKAIDLSTNTITTLATTTLGNCDGIARDGNGSYYVSAWSSSSVVKFDSSFSGQPVAVATNLSSPADIYYNILSDTLAIPNSGNNTVDYIGFSTVGINENITQDFRFFIEKKTLKLYSNTDLIFFNIYDLQGKLKLSGFLRKDEFISLEQLPTGIYLLQGKLESHTFGSKFLLVE